MSITSAITEMDSFRHKYGTDIIRGMKIFGINAINYRMNQQPTAPLFFGWDITYKCNFKCKFCDRWIVGMDTSGELNEEEALNVAKQIGEAGVWAVSIGGGEPLIRRDLPDIIAELKKHNVNVNVCTNGSDLKRMAKTLIDVGVDTISVSAESHSAEIHDKIRVFKDSFELILAGIEEVKSLRSNGRPRLMIRATVTKENYTELDKYMDFWRPKVDEVIIQPVHDSPESFFKIDKTQKFDKAEEEKFRETFDKTIEKHNELNKQYYKEFGDVFFNPQKVQEKYKCYAGDFFVLLDPYGNLWSCSSKMQKFVNFREKTFKDMWSGAEIKEFRKVLRNGQHQCFCWYNCTGILNCYLTKTLK